LKWIAGGQPGTQSSASVPHMPRAPLPLTRLLHKAATMSAHQTMLPRGSTAQRPSQHVHPPTLCSPSGLVVSFSTVTRIRQFLLWLACNQGHSSSGQHCGDPGRSCRCALAVACWSSGGTARQQPAEQARCCESATQRRSRHGRSHASLAAVQPHPIPIEVPPMQRHPPGSGAANSVTPCPARGR